MYVAPNKNLPGLKARSNALRAEKARQVAAQQARKNAQAVAAVAKAGAKNA